VRTLRPEVITKGRGKMPAFGAKIKPDDITKLVAYIRDCRKRNNKPCKFDCLYGEAFRPPASAVLWFLAGLKEPNHLTAERKADSTSCGTQQIAFILSSQV
jgi:hypothetical protein